MSSGFFSLKDSEPGDTSINTTAELQELALEDMQIGLVVIGQQPETIEDIATGVQGLYALQIQGETISGNPVNVLINMGQICDLQESIRHAQSMFVADRIESLDQMGGIVGSPSEVEMVMQMKDKIEEYANDPTPTLVSMIMNTLESMFQSRYRTTMASMLEGLGDV